MKDPTRLRDQAGLPDAFQSALREMGRGAPPAQAVARIQKTLSALPATQGSGLVALSWGKVTIGACALGLATATTWLALPRSEPIAAVPQEVRREAPAPTLERQQPDLPLMAAAVRAAEAPQLTPRVVAPASGAAGPAANVSRRDGHKHPNAAADTQRIATTSSEGAPPVAAPAVQSGAENAAAAAPTVPEPEPIAASPVPPKRPQGPAPEDEAGLLYRARKLALTDHRAAWRMVEQHAIHFPSGALVEEREVLAIELLERMGQKQEARQRSTRFLSQYPHSSYRSAVELRSAR